MFESIRHESSSPSVTPLLQSYTTPAKSETHAAAQDLPNPRFASDGKFGHLYGTSAAMQKVFQLITRVAGSDASVLIVGESGCGKELVAQTIHEMSQDSGSPFVAINCGALPVTLIESELFGYEKGAFTGAYKTHQGFFERAQGGTLFLDEITEMPFDLQVRLLRVLETGRFIRVGGDKEMSCQVRVLAATNREPLEAVRDRKLRLDLLYRLAVFPIVLPPLRERDNDVLLLANRFLQAKNEQFGTSKRFAPSVAEKLRHHDWPGNVRELKNCVHRAYILAESDKLVDIDTVALLNPCKHPCTGKIIEVEVGTPLEEVERQLIFATLDRFQGNKRRTAKALGISLKTIYNRLNFYADDLVDPPDIHPSMA